MCFEGESQEPVHAGNKGAKAFLVCGAKHDIAVVLESLLLAQVHRAITHLNLILGHSNLQLKFSTFILHRHVAFV